MDQEVGRSNKFGELPKKERFKLLLQQAKQFHIRKITEID